MRWHDVLTGRGFQSWIESITGGSNIRAGEALDPFTTSNRRLIRVAGWLQNIHDQGTVGADTPRTEEQAIIDLGRAKLVEREGTGVRLTELGAQVLSSWRDLNVANNSSDHEIARSIILAYFALQSNEEYYMRIMQFWREIRAVYDVDSLFSTPEVLALIGYLNQVAESFNPWDVIRASRVGLDVDLANDWQDLLAQLSAGNSALSASIEKFKERVLGWAGRSQGRVAFCMALELLSLPDSEAEAKLDVWGIQDDAKATCLNVLSQLRSVALDDPELLKIDKLLRERFNVILYGPPGTGKTRAAFLIAENWRTQFGLDSVFNVTFHPSYGYEDFVQGYRPNRSDPGKFTLEDGVLLKAARAAEEAALSWPENPKNYLIIIDEINRGDTARIFGELITYIEPDKRNIPFELAQLDKGARVIPNNLYFLGTMNTADKSISLIDVALRRRFAAVGMPPKPEIISNNPSWFSEIAGIELSILLKELNDRLLSQGVEPDRALGHALLKVNKDHPEPLRALHEHMEFDIYPLISEYCFMNRSAISEVLGGLVNNTGDWIASDHQEFVLEVKRICGDTNLLAQINTQD